MSAAAALSGSDNKLVPLIQSVDVSVAKVKVLSAACSAS